jgi:DNA-binding HxlR family transcriptional regulator
MLAQSLRQLEANGLVHRQVFAEVPPHVEYSLPPFGESIAPLLAELCDWSVTWEAKVQTFQPAAG